MRFAALFRYITLLEFHDLLSVCTIARSGTSNWFSLDSCIFQTHDLVVVIKGSLVGQSFADCRVTAVFLIHRSLRFHRILYDFSTQKQWNGKQLHAFC